MSAVITALDHFVGHYQKSAEFLIAEHDPEWPSPCEIGAAYPAPDGRLQTRWQPVRRDLASDFDGLERALETEVHPDIKAFYGRYWSASLHADAPDGPVSLIQLWNEEDTARLTENLIGHVLAQRRSRSPLSIFFATTTEHSEYFLGVRNDTGEVQLELPGRKPVRTVAADLASFIDSLAARPPEP